MRTPDELLKSALAVLDRALRFARIMRPLFSGGHDSSCACHVASKHPKWDGHVHHIDTGIGAERTRRHVEDACQELGWKLKVYKSPETYESIVRIKGFPGPGMHQWAYVRLKERCVRRIVKEAGLFNRSKLALVTGARRDESVRRMGYVNPIQIGEGTANRNRVWTAPCFDWSSEEQQIYMAEHDLPQNPVKLSLGMSGECFCGAFASPGELERIRQHAPDVAAEIDRLAVIARECGTHDKWGTRPDGRKGIAVVQSGPLCSSCDRRAEAAGIIFEATGS